MICKTCPYDAATAAPIHLEVYACTGEDFIPAKRQPRENSCHHMREPVDTSAVPRGPEFLEVLLAQRDA